MKIFAKTSPIQNSQRLGKLKNIEAKYNFIFPDHYLKFCTENIIGRNLEKWDSYLDKFYRPTPLYHIIIRTNIGPLTYNWLSSPNQIQHDLKHYPRVYDLLLEDGLIRIGDIIESGGLFLGVNESNLNRIYKFSYDIDEVPIQIFDTITDFVASLDFKFIEDYNSFEKIEGKRYFNKKQLEFASSDALRDLQILEHPYIETCTADHFLKSITKIIDDV